MAILIVLLAAAAAVVSYRLLEGWSGRSWLPATCRAAGWSVVALLLLNAGCPGGIAVTTPLVLLDGSLSMAAAGGRWREALALARESGDLRLIGAAPGDSLPGSGRTRLAPAVAAAAGSGRPVVLITDGEIEDADAIPAELLAGTTVRVLERRPTPDAALTRVEGTRRVTPSDSLRLDLEVQGFAGYVSRRLAVSAREGSQVWIRGSVALDSGGRGRVTLRGPVPAVGPGPHVLRVALDSTGDAEPRDDLRLFLVTVVPTPGVVLLASPPTWESRFLLEVLRDVSALPVRGFLETERGRWRQAGELRPVAESDVAAAARRADLLVTLGGVPAPARGSGARGRLVVSPPGGRLPFPGDWYLSVSPGTPLSSAMATLAVDSFPPGTALFEVAPMAGDWVGLTAQAGRRGAVRPAVIGRDSGGVRRVTMGVDGLWRWAFRGGSSEQGYRALLAASVTWLLGGADSTAGKARLLRDVVEQGRPATFEWVGSGPAQPVPVTFTGAGAGRSDTLAFDGAGRAEIMLPPGIWSYRLTGGGQGTVAVEEYSGEFLPTARTVAASEASVAPMTRKVPARTWLWLFGVGVVAFAGEWLARRRLGLR